MVAPWKQGRPLRVMTQRAELRCGTLLQSYTALHAHNLAVGSFRFVDGGLVVYISPCHFIHACRTYGMVW